MKQPYIHSAPLDLTFIIAPAFISILLVILFPGVFQSDASLSEQQWVILVLCIDVAHVYSTLYRSYLDKGMVKTHRREFVLVPVICLVAAILCYGISSLVFWRLMAYLAVWHFIRQQYGFMRLYSRREQLPSYKILVDKLSIYAATVYPIIFWHLTPGRQFNWFVPDDFMYFRSDILLKTSGIIYCLILIAYIGSEIVLSIKQKRLNIPKNLIIAATFLSWYLGIVYYNSDMAFTVLNVVSHGIPYMALVWISANKRAASDPASFAAFTKLALKVYGLPLFIGLLFVLAYLEEGLWDGFIWHDHQAVFAVFQSLPLISKLTIANILVPILALPQLTHYVLDGFIWKVSKDKTFSN